MSYNQNIVNESLTQTFDMDPMVNNQILQTTEPQRKTKTKATGDIPVSIKYE